MGSGNRLSCGRTHGFALGFNAARFPFAVTIGISIGFWYVSLGLGKPYDAI